MKEKPYLESGKKFRTWHQKVTSNIFLLQVYSPCNVVSFCFATILRNKKDNILSSLYKSRASLIGKFKNFKRTQYGI